MKSFLRYVMLAAVFSDVAAAAATAKGASDVSRMETKDSMSPALGDFAATSAKRIATGLRIQWVQWSPDSRLLIGLIPGKGHRVFDVETGQTLDLHASEYEHAFVGWSPSADCVVAKVKGNRIKITRLARKPKLRIVKSWYLPAPDVKFPQFVWGRRHGRLAAVFGSKVAWVDLPVELSVSSSGDSSLSIDWDQNGLVSRWNGVGRKIDIGRPRVKRPVGFYGAGGRWETQSWDAVSPRVVAGERILYPKLLWGPGDGIVYVECDLDGANRHLFVAQGDGLGQAFSRSLSPDGRFYVMASTRPELRGGAEVWVSGLLICSASTGEGAFAGQAERFLALDQLGIGASLWPLWSPDGAMIAVKQGGDTWIVYLAGYR